MVSYGPIPADEPHVAFFRRGEITLFFEGPNPGTLDPQKLIATLNAALGGVDVPVTAVVNAPSQFNPPRVSQDNPFTGPDGKERPPLIVQRADGEPPGVLQTVNLDTWIPEQQRRDLEAKQDFGELSRGIVEVGVAVQRLNRLLPEGGITWGGLTLTAASPNWLLMPFAECF